MLGNCKKVYEILGEDAIEKIKQNPYILLDITYGIDFNKIDKMAIVRVNRKEEFAPVKNKIGVDSAETAKEAYIKYYKNGGK